MGDGITQHLQRDSYSVIINIFALVKSRWNRGKWNMWCRADSLKLKLVKLVKSYVIFSFFLINYNTKRRRQEQQTLFYFFMGSSFYLWTAKMHHIWANRRDLDAGITFPSAGEL